ncbi:MAG: YceI family protein [Lautropia sp.]|nr:YceI family protein [Lautropia sp.]
MKNLLKLSAASILLAAFSVPALAAPKTYVIDPTHTFPQFSYNHMGLSVQQSRFNNTSGKVVFDPAAKKGSVDIEIDMASVSTGSEKFDEHIKSADFFDVAKFPKATFKSTNVKFDGDKPVLVEGDLTIKGVTKPVTLEIVSFAQKEHPMKRKDTIGANAHVSIKRSEFNAGKFAPVVGDDVLIQISLEASVE